MFTKLFLGMMKRFEEVNISVLFHHGWADDIGYQGNRRCALAGT